MKVRELRVVADAKLAKTGGQIDELVGSCWEETLDPEPYTLGEGGRVASANAFRLASRLFTPAAESRKGAQLT